MLDDAPPEEQSPKGAGPAGTIVDSAADSSGSAGDEEDDLRCDQCGTQSPRGYRFCLGCGSVLSQAEAKPAVVDEPLGKAVVVAAEPELAPQPVVAIEEKSKKASAPSPSPSDDDQSLCRRCGGKCEPGEAFCKYCGAPLSRPRTKEEPPEVAAPQPQPTPDPAVKPDKAAAGTVRETPLEQVFEPDKKTERPPAKLASPQLVAEVSGRLVVIVEDGTEGKVLDLTGKQVDIGRNEGEIILKEDRYLSPRHARFFKQGKDWFLRDLGSTNGVFRRLRKPESLGEGDLVLLGLEVLQFELVKHAERGLGHAIEHGTLVFGSPAATRPARLCQRTVEGVTRDVYHLISDETTIGREIGDIVFTSDPFMSRRHAAIRWNKDKAEFVLTDLNSSNGTYLAIRDDVRLANGDFIRLGQHLFRVDLL